MNSPTLIINPAAGNEPIIMGAAIALAINRQLETSGSRPLTVVLPITGARQLAVLKDEFGAIAGSERLVVDEAGGAILAPLLRSQANFSQHLQLLHEQYDQLQSALNQRYGGAADQPLAVQRLDGTALSIAPADIVGSLSTGGRVALDTLRKDYVFPVVISELLTAVRPLSTGIDDGLIAAVAERLRDDDRRYDHRFIPLVNTLSPAQEADWPMEQKFEQLLAQPGLTAAGRIIYTPPIKHALTDKNHADVRGDGLYAMLSGTDQGAANTLAATLRAAGDLNLTVYTNPWADETAGTVRISPAALRDPRIKAVISRAGWGTGWQLLNLAKPWLLIPPQPGDDPEIRLNNQVASQLGIGAVVEPDSFDGRQLQGLLDRLTPQAEALRSLTAEHFGSSDGIDFVARQLAPGYRF